MFCSVCAAKISVLAAAVLIPAAVLLLFRVKHGSLDGLKGEPLPRRPRHTYNPRRNR